MSNFVVSARKYRPTRFDEVVGQEHVSQTLKNAFKNDHLAHAFLFCGPRGVGKTTSARILAKVLNCENVTEDFEPCNKCGSCQAFNSNASFNITELDAASNNSVEHIRALIEQVRFQPQQGRFKIFIIDEVHMLSQQAFNAFLKTLEEPPAYAKFILATTEKHKIIPTILSRCQIFDFNRISIPSMVEHLKSICQEEGIAADPDALHIIAQKADGALRDSLSIFDRIVSFSGKNIEYDDVIKNLNVLDYDYFFRLLDAMLGEDISTVMLVFDEILRKGFDPSVFINSFAEHIRNILVSKDKQTLQLLEVGDNLKSRYFQQAKIAPMSFLLAALNLANECDVHYKMARNKRLHVEMSLIKMTYLMRAVNAAVHASQTAAINGSQKKNNIGELSQQLSAEPSGSYQAGAKKTAPTPALTDKETVAASAMDLKAIEASIEAEEKEAEANKKPFTEANLKEYWTAFTNNISSPSVKNAFETAKYKIENDTILVEVSNALKKSAIQSERGLLPFLKDQFKLKELFLSIEVVVPKASANELSQKSNKPLSARQIFVAMRGSNPAVDELRKRLDLYPD